MKDFWISVYTFESNKRIEDLQKTWKIIGNPYKFDDGLVFVLYVDNREIKTNDITDLLPTTNRKIAEVETSGKKIVCNGRAYSNTKAAMDDIDKRHTNK